VQKFCQQSLNKSVDKMMRSRRRVPRKGNATIHTIRITGFEQPLVIEAGMKVMDWKDSFRAKVKAESERLRQLAADMREAEEHTGASLSCHESVCPTPVTGQTSQLSWNATESDEFSAFYQSDEDSVMLFDP
jgi:hypothetical protein